MRPTYAVAALLALNSLGLLAQSGQRSTRDGVYSDSQAGRGQAVYTENCAACHGMDLAGDPFAPPLTGAPFSARWNGRPLGDLFDLMRLTMPQNFPGGLNRERNAELLAFILQQNRLPAGTADLPLGSDMLGRIAFVPLADDTASPAVPVRVGRAPAPRVSAGEPVDGGYYTAEQAESGRVQFNRVCTPCHVSGDAPPPSKTGRGFWLGDQHLLLNLGGRYAHKYPSVYHLFRRVRDSMPSSDADSVSVAAKVDIVAYMLQQNGFPAGRTPLPLDVVAMKGMRLNGGSPEAGFERVFNGKDFTGIGFLIGPNCRPAPQGCGRTEPGTTFTAQNGAIVTDGKVQGYWYTEKRYFNFTLRFDVRHVPPPDWDPGDDYFDGNSGYLLYVTEHRVWPKGIEIQGNHLTMLAPIGMDAMAKYTDDDEARMRARRPAGEWQSVEIVAGGGQVKSYLNNVLVTTVTEHEFKEAGHIGFQSEGAELHWRNIRIKAQ